MGHQRKSLDERSNVVPDIREYRCIISVLRSQSVYPLAEPLVVLRLGVDKESTISPSRTITTPTEHTLDGSSFAVSKSIAAKSLIIFKLSSVSLNMPWNMRLQI